MAKKSSKPKRKRNLIDARIWEDTAGRYIEQWIGPYCIKYYGTDAKLVALSGAMNAIKKMCIFDSSP